MEGEAEVLRRLEGEPLALVGVLAEREAVVGVRGVDEVEGKVLRISRRLN